MLLAHVCMVTKDHVTKQGLDLEQKSVQPSKKEHQTENQPYAHFFSFFYSNFIFY